MAVEIFKLMGSIFVDSSAAEKSIAQTGKSAETLSGKLGGAVKGAAAVGAGLATAAAAGGAALFKLADDAAGTADNIDKMSQKMGISAEGFQELEHVMNQTGGNVDSMVNGMKTLRNTMMEVQSGNEASAEAFEALGVSVTNSDGTLRDQEDVMWECIDALQNMEDGADKMALANELFGKSGTELIPLLNGEAGSMQALRDEAHDLGLVMSQDAVDAGVQFGDNLANVKDALGAVFTTIGTEVMPIFNSMLEWILEHMPEIQEVMRTVFEAIGAFVQKAMEIIKELAPVFETLIGFIVDSWENVIQPLLDGMVDFITGVFSGDLEKAFGGIIDIATTIFGGIVDVFRKPFEAAAKVVSDVIDGIKGLFNFEWKLPKIKLPHFGIEPKGWSFGDLLHGSLPRLSIDWYAKAMDEGMIMNKPTVFGYNDQTGQLMAGGEAGSEVVVGTESLRGMIGDAVGNGITNPMVGMMQQMIGIMSEYFPQFAEQSVVMDTGALVGQIAPQMNRTLGAMAARKGRSLVW